ncbi:oligosaccharide repeat unit polymerase [Salinicoccus cyprini]|uniref:Oligosaccharide repeat unit polymerase n=1 Tax=Salinicoccus cyprini TaxID=2493691 RepID=A0A558AXD3_9STAP|nr:O-antigen polymerase [Salinicoccus cyprini]TVT28911.1 oligosaccharide repeat unit polymerase [Salinicoccus cyprini]
MSLLENNEKIILFCVIMFNFLIFLIIGNLLLKSQSKLKFLHPGWIILVSLFLYSQITPIYLLFVNITNISNQIFLSLYNFNDFLKIYLLYTFVAILILLCEIFILYYLKDKKEEKLKLKINLSKSLAVLYIGFFLFALAVVMFIYSYNSLVNINANLIFDKVERIESNNISSLISYINLYMASFIFLFIAFFNSNNKGLKTSIIFLFIVASLVVFYMGTTLQVLLMIIAFVYIGKAFDKVNVAKTIKYIIVILPIFFVLMNVSETYREYKLNLTDNFTIFSLPDLTTFESVTGFISGLILLNSDYIIESYGLIDFVLGLFPGSILNFINYEHIPMTTLIDNSFAVSSYSTYVPTLPVSMLPYIELSVIIIPLIYLIAFFIINILTSRSISLFVISTIFYIDLFYMIRINIEAWLGKLRLDIFVLLTFIILYKISEKILRKYISVRRIKI